MTRATEAFAGTLTPAHLELIAETRDEWMRCALSTERCDRPEMERLVTAAYAAAGYDAPAFVWMDSPEGGALAAAALDQLRDQLRDQLWGQLRDQLRGQLRDQLRDQLWDQLWDQLRDQLWGQLWGQLRDQLWGQLWGQLGGQLWDQLGDQLRDQLWDQLRAAIDPWGDAYWLTMYRLALPLAGIPGNERLASIAAATAAGGWWWPRVGVAVLTDRPTAIRRDQQGRLHADGQAALSYADGYELHSWHGTTVPADFWGWSVEDALRQDNAELRRCAIERVGWDKLTDRLTLVASAPDPGNDPHLLYLYDLPDDLDLYDTDQPVRILLCTNGTQERDGTRHRFGLPVPGHHTDPVAAAAELYDMPVEAYRRASVRR